MDGSYKINNNEGYISDGMELETKIEMQKTQVLQRHIHVNIYISRYLLTAGLQKISRLLLLGQILP